MKPKTYFFTWAGYSWDPAKETQRQGRQRCAARLAQAEAWGRDNGLSFAWEVDQDCDSREFSKSRPHWSLWCCIAYNDAGKIVACLGGVDFGRGGVPEADTYRRVVEAELALEVCP